ncbi:unnamed protein product [Sphagnum balticum]
MDVHGMRLYVSVLPGIISIIRNILAFLGIVMKAVKPVPLDVRLAAISCTNNAIPVIMDTAGLVIAAMLVQLIVQVAIVIMILIGVILTALLVKIDST